MTRQPANDATGTDTPDRGLSGTDLVVRYPGGDDPVIDGESVTVPVGDVTALIGPNGSGKSTLLNALANKHSPADGTVLLDGHTIDELGSKELARRLGLLSQENVTPGGISVRELVERGRYPHQGFFDSLTDADRAAVTDALRVAGVDHLSGRDVGSLSGGQKQLVWIAMALAQDTDVLLLDEPTTFLDPHHQLEVMDIIQALRDDHDTTVVVVLHDINQAARYADHVIALKDGTIHARGQPADVVTKETLRTVFDIEATVSTTSHGMQVVPIEALHDEDGTDHEHAPGSRTPTRETAADGGTSPAE